MLLAVLMVVVLAVADDEDVVDEVDDDELNERISAANEPASTFMSMLISICILLLRLLSSRMTFNKKRRNQK